MKKIIASILYRFKERALEKKIRGDREVEYKSLKEMKSGLIFWTTDGKNANWDKESRGRWEGIHFDRLCFVPDGVECTEGEEVVRLCRGDLRFGGKIRNERLQELLAREYDLLIDLNRSASPIIHYVIANSRAHLIAGWKKAGGIADIRVAGVEEPHLFLNELSKILAEIKKF